MTLERKAVHPWEIRRVHRLVARAAALPDIRTEVEANHDENRWWPTSIADPRMRMLAAGWSTRISYRMVETYARVIASADAQGFDSLAAAADADLTALVRPIGLARPGSATCAHSPSCCGAGTRRVLIRRCRRPTATI
jgi:hypothetical protein